MLVEVRRLLLRHVSHPNLCCRLKVLPNLCSTGSCRIFRKRWAGRHSADSVRQSLSRLCLRLRGPDLCAEVDYNNHFFLPDSILYLLCRSRRVDRNHVWRCGVRMAILSGRIISWTHFPLLVCRRKLLQGILSPLIRWRWMQFPFGRWQVVEALSPYWILRFGRW